MDKKVKILNLILPLLTIGAVLGIWSIGALVVDSEYILPSVAQTLSEFGRLLVSVQFYLAFFSTFIRTVLAFIICFFLAFILAVLCQRFSLLKRITDTLVSIIRALPTIAVILILLFWTSSRVSAIIVTALVVFPTLYTQLTSAFSSVDKTVLEAGRVDGADEKRVFALVQLPQALPSVLNGVGSGFSLNFKLMVAAEVIAQTANSIGYLLNTSKVYFEIANMLAIVCFTVVIGVAIEFIFNLLSERIGKWR